MTQTRGKFITLEGIDGAGKSTQLEGVAEFLRSKGLSAMVTREPGGTPLGEKLRTLLLDKTITMHAQTEALLMFASRCEHLDRVIVPALEQGRWVVSDRFTDASFAYQGGGRELDMSKLDMLENWTHGNFQPDLTLYFDVPVELGQQRINQLNSIDRFEKEEKDFFHRVRTVYLERAEQFPERIQYIDATQPAPAVHEAVEQILQKLFIDE